MVLAHPGAVLGRWDNYLYISPDRKHSSLKVRETNDLDGIAVLVQRHSVLEAQLARDGWSLSSQTARWLVMMNNHGRGAHSVSIVTTEPPLSHYITGSVASYHHIKLALMKH